MEMEEYLESQREHERQIWLNKSEKIKKIRKLKSRLPQRDDIREELENLERIEMDERDIVGEMIDRINEVLD